MSTRAAIRAHIAAQTCPWCGAGPFKMLPVHTAKRHGVDKWALRDLAGLSTRDPLSSAETRSAMAASYDRDRGAAVRTLTYQRAPRRWTEAGRAVRAAKV